MEKEVDSNKNQEREREIYQVFVNNKLTAVMKERKNDCY